MIACRHRRRRVARELNDRPDRLSCRSVTRIDVFYYHSIITGHSILFHITLHYVTRTDVCCTVYYITLRYVTFLFYCMLFYFILHYTHCDEDRRTVRYPDYRRSNIWLAVAACRVSILAGGVDTLLPAVGLCQSNFFRPAFIGRCRPLSCRYSSDTGTVDSKQLVCTRKQSVRMSVTGHELNISDR